MSRISLKKIDWGWVFSTVGFVLMSLLYPVVTLFLYPWIHSVGLLIGAILIWGLAQWWILAMRKRKLLLMVNIGLFLANLLLWWSTFERDLYFEECFERYISYPGTQSYAECRENLSWEELVIGLMPGKQNSSN